MIAEDLNLDPATCARAAQLAKCDLLSQMVGEFPELQGLMGAHYARAGGETASRIDPERFRYLRLQFEDDRLVGAIGLGLTQHVGILRGLIQSRLRLGVWKRRLLADPTRIMEAYLACTQFPQDIRPPL